MRRISKTIVVILCAGAVLALAGEALADGRYQHSRRHDGSRGWSRPSYSRGGWGLSFGSLGFTGRSYAGRPYGLSYYGGTSPAYSGYASNRGSSGWYSAPRFHAAQQYGACPRPVPSRSYCSRTTGFAASIGPVRVLIVPSGSRGGSWYGRGPAYSYRRGCR